ncbi:hypothetical protein [Nocardia blacklockiae]|uniref:hypothetical protein n=1 Tax=Nocardia blacklockiae TaxID=480036 RepID=UPI001893183D|nr:hypothetical protein [Nocardia blacklockiae]MBF6172873.1 hypothetical protein [Nocardia blacklockiae]
MKRTELVRRIALAVLATGAVGAATTLPAAAADSATAEVAPAAAVATDPAPIAPSGLLDVLPNPLNCLLTTGFAVFCLGVPLS